MPDGKPATQGTGEGGGARPPSSLIHGTDLWVTVVLLAFCGAAWYATTTFDEVSPLFASNIPPSWFPRLLIWCIAILALTLPFEHLFLAGGRRRLDEDRSDRVKPITIVTVGLLLFVVLSIDIIGMALATVVVSALLPLLWGERRPRVLIPFAILFPTAVALLFSQVLNIYFEPGALGLAVG